MDRTLVEELCLKAIRSSATRITSHGDSLVGTDGAFLPYIQGRPTHTQKFAAPLRETGVPLHIKVVQRGLASTIVYLFC